MIWFTIGSCLWKGILQIETRGYPPALVTFIQQGHAPKED